MSFRNASAPSKTLNNSIAAGFGVREPGKAAKESTIKSRFKNAGPRDRIQITVSNVPGLKNGADEFAVRVWRDNSVPGGYGVSVNCLKMTAAEFKGSAGRAMIEKYVKASKAEDMGVDNEKLGKQVAEIIAATKNRYERMEKLDALVGKAVVVDPALVTHLHSSLISTISAGLALLAPLPKGA